MIRFAIRILPAALSGALFFTSAAKAQAPSGPGTFNVDSLVEANPIAKEQKVRIDVISWDSASSVQLTQVSGSVDSHRHLSHDENVWVIRGAGRLTLGEQKLKVKAGDVIHIPKGTPHAFHNLGSKPAVVISVFSPGFDGKDRVFDDQAGK